MILEVPAECIRATPGRGGPVLICVRPEELTAHPDAMDNTVAAQILSTVFYGPTLRLFVETNAGQKLMIDMGRRRSTETFDAGATVHVRPVRGSGRLLDKD
jgi:spermidine/putrescine transport system ATP-binding protein